MSNEQPSVRIKIRKNGSSLVSGPVIIEHTDGTEEVKERFSLCRCGASKNMPFCDGQHNEIGFNNG
jgi:CDGSH-type Zn-finger protein